MKQYGPDSLHSWIVTVSCCLINTMTFGLSGLSGIFFVASVSMFNSTRRQASLPYTLSMFVRCCSGPLVSWLGLRCGIRNVTIFGCVLGALGIGICFFARNIEIVTVSWGVIFGLGFGFGNTLLSLMINECFVKYKTTAMGVFYAGSAIGSFILPPVVEALFQLYGLSGTYMLLGGFLLNCIPAALVLKRSNFSTSASSFHELEVKDIENIVPANKVSFYAGDDSSQEFDESHKEDEYISPAMLQIPRIEIEGISRNNSFLSHDEKIRRLSTQTLLSNYLVRMSCAGILDIDEMIENNKSIKKIDKTVLHPEDLCWSQSSITGLNPVANVMSKNSRFSSMQYDKPLLLKAFNEEDRKLSLKSSASETENTFFAKNLNIKDKDFYYQASLGSIRRETLTSSHSIPKIKFTRGSVNISSENCGLDFTENFDKVSVDAEKEKLTDSSCQLSNRTVSFNLETNPKLFLCCSSNNCRKKSKTHLMSLLLDPIFILITITFATFTPTLICMLIIIVDFACDIQVETYKLKYVIMTISAANLLVSLGIGRIMELAFISLLHFTAICFAVQGIASVATVYSGGFSSLLAIVFICGIAQAVLLIIFPIILEKYLDLKKQRIANQLCNFLSAPLVLIISPSIGHFRDKNGSYDPIFYGMGVISAICCISWLVASYFVKRRNENHHEYDENPN